MRCPTQVPVVKEECIKMDESVRYPGIPLCILLSSGWPLSVIPRSNVAFRSAGPHCEGGGLAARVRTVKLSSGIGRGPRTKAQRAC
jgi:hypothetical protein